MKPKPGRHLQIELHAFVRVDLGQRPLELMHRRFDLDGPSEDRTTRGRGALQLVFDGPVQSLHLFTHERLQR
ncbi:MAG: hypothetical protein ACREXX_07630, partial [Gammaproteobacteria bacterium]